MLLKGFAAVLSAVPVVEGMLRFSCSQLVVDRFDPIVNPGVLPSGHVHQIAGGNSFNVTMDPSIDLAEASTCTSCTFSENFSNYWTANMYFQSRNGSLERVPQMANQYLEGANAGMTIYYVQPSDGSKVTAFAPGFRMIAGDAGLRTDNYQFNSMFRCFEADFANQSSEIDDKYDSRTLPTRPCPGGIRTMLFFPTCWDGKNLDSPDHKSHVAYPAYGGFNSNSACPASHPVQLPQLFFEIMWDTREFNDLSRWPKDGTQPFVFSMGDRTGYGQHGDYMFGWQGDSLQRAMDEQCDIFCPTLKQQSYEAANECTLPRFTEEDIDGPFVTLPGNNPLTGVSPGTRRRR